MSLPPHQNRAVRAASLIAGLLLGTAVLAQNAPASAPNGADWNAMRDQMHSTMNKFIEQRESTALDAAGLSPTQKTSAMETLKKARESRYALMQQQRQAMQTQQEQVDQQLSTIMGAEKLKVFQNQMRNSMPHKRHSMGNWGGHDDMHGPGMGGPMPPPPPKP